MRWAPWIWRCGTSRAKCYRCRSTKFWAARSATYCECYNTSGIIPGVRHGMSIKERAQLTIAAGYRAFRMGAAEAPANGTYNTHERLNQLYEDCVQAREGVGKNGDWCIDFHQRFDLSDAIRGCNLIQDLTPYFVEDPVRTEAFLEDIPILRRKVNVPLAAGEEWGNRWDFNKLVENHDIDYVRATLPNVGGITEMMKIAAICETHFVGIVPHFTGPDRHRGTRQLSEHFFGTGADGVQLPGPYASAFAGVSRFQRTVSSIRTIGRAWAWNSI